MAGTLAKRGGACTVVCPVIHAEDGMAAANPAEQAARVAMAGCIMQIRTAVPDDGEAIWQALEPVVREGETYALPRDMTREAALAYWQGADRTTFVAEEDGQLLGTYYLRANQLGGGAHVANCGYVTRRAASGRGVARAMCEHSLAEAGRRGFRAMQFNFVISTNARAVALWSALGFETIGVLPQAFLHPRLGYVDALTMFRRVDMPAL